MSNQASSLVPLLAFPLVKMIFQASGALYAAGCARHYPEGTRVRRTWALLCLGPAFWFCGQLSAVVDSLVRHGSPPALSLHDLFIFAGGACVIGACFSFVGLYRASGFAVDGGPKDTILLAGGTVPLVVVGYPLLRQIWSAPEGTLEHLVDSGYPVLDLLMLAAALLLLRMALRFHGGRVWHVWAAILAGLACATGGDILFSMSSMRNLASASLLGNLSLVACYALVALGVRTQFRMVST